MSTVDTGAKHPPLSPLLDTAGAAATATGRNSDSKQRDDEKTTACPEDAPAPEGPVCSQAMEPALTHCTELDQGQVMEGEREWEAYKILQAENEELKKTLFQKEELLKKAEKKHQKAVEEIDQLEAKKSELTDQVKRLRNTVQDLGNLLAETQEECDSLTSECEREWESYRNLLVENEKIKKTLIQKEELLKVSCKKAEKKQQKAVRSIMQLKADKCHLTNKVIVLQDTVQFMETWLAETQVECDKLADACEQKLEDNRILCKENEEMKTLLVHIDEEVEREQQANRTLQLENDEPKQQQKKGFCKFRRKMWVWPTFGPSP